MDGELKRFLTEKAAVQVKSMLRCPRVSSKDVHAHVTQRVITGQGMLQWATETKQTSGGCS
jgi:hypothetical protein